MSRKGFATFLTTVSLTMFGGLASTARIAVTFARIGVSTGVIRMRHIGIVLTSKTKFVDWPLNSPRVERNPAHQVETGGWDE
jgi:hypothetical protein